MKPALIVHGGAGLYSETPPEVAAAGVAAAWRRGQDVLDRGGSALDAVEAAVRAMEDDETFNAGRGSTLNSDGDVEMDACVALGSLATGAVAAVQRVKNPVTLARRVMEKTPHVLLAAGGAERFAREQGVELVSPAELITPAALERFRRGAPPHKHGTVGAAAIDANGSLAAATSTGGIFRKLPGRVGDTPIFGAGTYADDALGAASATGVGEAIIKAVLCFRAVNLLRDGLAASDAARRAIDELGRRTGSEAGVIVVSKSGDVGHAFNTRRMARAFARGAGVDAALEELARG